jgi:tetratricopeptide (TPR) repeat protein
MPAMSSKTRARPTLAPILAGLLAVCACRSTEEGQPPPEQLLSLHTELALRYYDLDDLERAEQQARKGLDIDPDDKRLRLLLGWIRQRRGKTEDILVAEKVFRSLIDTDDYRAELGLAGALERKGVLYAESARSVRTGERETEFPDTGARAEQLELEARTSWTESVRFYERTLANKPNDVQAMSGLQRVFALLGDDGKSIEWSRHIVTTTAAELSFWNAQLDRPELTAAEEKRLRELVDSSIQLQIASHLAASSSHRRLGQLDEAIANLDAVLALRPDQPNVHSQRAQFLQEGGHHAEAIASIDEFLRLSNLDFSHPDIRRAYSVRSISEAALRSHPAPAPPPGDGQN